MPAHRARHEARSGAPRHRHQAAVLRARSPSRPTTTISWARRRTCGLLRRGGLQFGYGLLSGGGVGFVMAQWIIDGHAPMDVWSVDIAGVCTPGRTTAATCRSHRRVARHRLPGPLAVPAMGKRTQRQAEHSARPARRRRRLLWRVSRLGAANWYRDRRARVRAYQYSWGRQNWFENNAEEHRAVRERVGLFEQSSFAKLLVQGRDAVTVLNRIATASVACRSGAASTRSSSINAAASRPI